MDFTSHMYHAPLTSVLPAKRPMGPRGDAIIEADWCVGQLIEKLEKEGLLENTLIVFSSDNGPGT